MKNNPVTSIFPARQVARWTEELHDLRVISDPVPDNYDRALYFVGEPGNRLITEEQVASMNGGVSFRNHSWTEVHGHGVRGLASLILPSGSLELVDLEGNTGLLLIDVSNNDLAALSLALNVGLLRVDCSQNSIDELIVGALTSLVALDCSDNAISLLDVSSNVNLRSLRCSGNGIATLGLRSNEDLEVLDCSGNPLEDLDVSANQGLVELVASDTLLGEVDITTNSGLKKVDLSGNPLTEGAVDAILIKLDEFGILAGECFLAGTQVPSESSLAARQGLLEKGWTLQLDGIY